MKRIAIAAVLAVMGTAAHADTYVNGHFRKDGTYVQPHYRSNPNNSTFDNYGTKGNSNPYTGEKGTADPYASSNRLYQPYNSYNSRRKW
jgi:hypothetical protein